MKKKKTQEIFLIGPLWVMCSFWTNHCGWRMRHSLAYTLTSMGKVREVGILVGGDDGAAIKTKKDAVSRKRRMDGEKQPQFAARRFCLSSVQSVASVSATFVTP